jgi:ribosomal protein L3 glutamine methyltransferase
MSAGLISTGLTSAGPRAVAEPTRLLALIDEAATRLDAAGVAFGHGTTNSHDEAAWLVLWSLGMPLDALDECAEQLIDIASCNKALDLVDKRITTRQPTAYLTGEAWLHGVPFDIDTRAIVPRSLIAEPLVDGRLDDWLVSPSPCVLDLCTGNGSLAVLAAMAWPDATLDACDLSQDALAVAERNVQRHGLRHRIKLHQGDGLNALPTPTTIRYDMILCNPPYVNASSMAALPAEFRHEPAMALASGNDGMDFTRQLLPRCANHLQPHGVLVLEIGHELAHFERAFPRLEALWLETSGGDASVALITVQALTAWQATQGPST